MFRKAQSAMPLDLSSASKKCIISTLLILLAWVLGEFILGRIAKVELDVDVVPRTDIKEDGFLTNI